MQSNTGPNPFTERYKIKSSTDLIEIIDSPEDYQALAVDAAKLELASRQLTTDQFNEARLQSEARRKTRSTGNPDRSFFDEKLQTPNENFIDLIDPLYQDEPTPTRDREILAAILGVTMLFMFYTRVSTIVIMFSLIIEDAFDFSIVLYIVPVVVVSAACVLLWLKKKWGWILGVFHFAFASSSMLRSTIMSFQYDYEDLQLFGLPIDPKTYYVAVLMVDVAIVIYFCIPRVRKLYDIDKRTMVAVIGVGALLARIVIAFL